MAPVGCRIYVLHMLTWTVKLEIIEMGVSKNRGTPKWMVYNGKPLLKWDDLGGKPHYFRKHPNHCNHDLWQPAGLQFQAVSDGSRLLERSIEARSSRGWPCGCLAEICRQQRTPQFLTTRLDGIFLSGHLESILFFVPIDVA